MMTGGVSLDSGAYSVGVGADAANCKPEQATITSKFATWSHTHTNTLHTPNFLFYFTGNRDDITIPDELIKRVNSLDTIYQNIVASKEAAIDSEGIRLLSSIGREQV
jgi:hypothetical protein